MKTDKCPILVQLNFGITDIKRNYCNKSTLQGVCTKDRRTAAQLTIVVCAAFAPSTLMTTTDRSRPRYRSWLLPVVALRVAVKFQAISTAQR
jgi:hypothetical protein